MSTTTATAHRGRESAGRPAVSIVVPTFNEAGNVEELLRRLAAALPADLPAEVIFVDDSTDHTAQVIAEVAWDQPFPVVLITRATPVGGLGGAVVEGLRIARAPWAVVMDADLQHPPSVVPRLLAAGRLAGSDLVVATRYVEGGSSDGLGNAYRRVVSSASKALAATVLGGAVARLSDPLSGFFAVRLDALPLETMRPIGYKVLLELIVRARLTEVTEVAFSFGTRHAGESKSTVREGLRYLRHVRALRRVQRELSRPAAPILVAAGGVRDALAGRDRRPLGAPGAADPIAPPPLTWERASA